MTEEAYLPPPPELGQFHHLLPKEWDLDPIEATWMRGLVASALELRLPSLCWHLSRDEHGAAVATGYITVVDQHEADPRRDQWAHAFGMSDDGAGGYTVRSGGLRMDLPDAYDPDERCRYCGQILDPRDARNPPDGATYDRHRACHPN